MKPEFYVDGLVWSNKWGKKWCHLMTPGTEEDLIRFGELLGLKRSWLQKSGTDQVHFDITEQKREQAIAAGAIPMNSQEMFRRCVIPKRRRKPAPVPVPLGGAHV